MASQDGFSPLWGNWILDKRLGKGSFGGVYLAYRADAPEFRSAVKHLSIPQERAELDALMAEGVFCDDAGAWKYYEQLKDDILSEIRFMYRLRGHANIVAYEDHEVLPKRDMPGYDIFIRMELLEPLGSRAQRGALGRDEVCRLGADVCAALSALEQERIVHRDIKPANILVAPNGTYKLADFGVARQMEKTCTVMSKKGTYAYMAPEVFHGAQAGAASDIYSLGLVLHRLMNGNRAPFLPREGDISHSDTELALAKRLAGRELPRPAYADDALAAVISRACAFKPQERYACAADMRRALMRCLDPEVAQYDEQAMPWERNSSDGAIGALTATGASPRLERIRTIRENDAELSASLKRKYTQANARSKKRALIIIAALVALCALLALALYLIKRFS